MKSQEKMTIYIDSNIWLDLYHFSDNDLKEFAKLNTQTQPVTIHLPEQTRDEVRRNRITKISDARKTFENIKFNHTVPNLYKEFTTDLEKFQKLNLDLITHFENWKDKVSLSIVEKSLRADTVIDDLFQISNKIDTDNYYDLAIKRMNIGNPPGKKTAMEMQ